uniref:GH84 domain-containing protein n=1 Tax=Strigops habroptila TaxID=2489341 RepID=A0A672URP6_STRHB
MVGLSTGSTGSCLRCQRAPAGLPEPGAAVALQAGAACKLAWKPAGHGAAPRKERAPLRRWGLNCYMYAPKDELKHRLLWREPYTEHEAAHMCSLIEAAQEQGVEFVFAISAGQDMVFSSAGDRLLLQQKLRQVAAMGCRSFALLFDDIDPCMCQADRDAFPSLAQAQASVANEVYQELGQPPIFLFCPTEYCSSLCSPSPSQSCYLLTIGRELLPGISVIWTGEHPAQQCGTCGPAQLLSKRHSLQTLQPRAPSRERQHPVPPAPLIDGAGASPGPTASLTPEEARSSPMSLLTLEEAVSGPTVALTPKEARTSPTAPVTPEKAGSVPIAPLTPEKRRSSPTAPLMPDEPRSSPTVLLTPEEPMSSPTAPLTPEEPRSSPTAPLTPEEPRPSPTAPLTLGEVRMLVELFYLPYHHGPLAQHLLEHFQWLQANSLSVGVSAAAPSAGAGRWRSRAQSFARLCTQTCRLHVRLVGAAGRALLYDLHPYLWDIRNVLLAASAFIQWLGCQSITAPILLQGDAEPWAQRGGLFGELQALLPVGNSSDLFYQPPPLFPSRQLYVLRPLLPQDKGELYRMCREGLDCDPKVAEILVAHPDLLGDRLLGSFLSLSPEYTFVLEDEAGPCGYAAGALCAEGFLQQRDHGWLPAMRHKYPRDLEALLFFHTEPAAVPLPVLRRFPSLVQLGTATRTLDAGASRSLALCLLSALRANGSRGVFCQVSAADQQQLSFYSKLGFVALPVAWDGCPGAWLLGRLL